MFVRLPNRTSMPVALLVCALPGDLWVTPDRQRSGNSEIFIYR